MFSLSWQWDGDEEEHCLVVGEKDSIIALYWALRGIPRVDSIVLRFVLTGDRLTPQNIISKYNPT